MKKITAAAAFFILVISGGGQNLTQRHDSIVVNISVPVRVLKDGRFVDTLTMEDFLIYDDGVLQETEAFYLVKKMEIQRAERRADTASSRLAAR